MEDKFLAFWKNGIKNEEIRDISEKIEKENIGIDDQKIKEYKYNPELKKLVDDIELKIFEKNELLNKLIKNKPSGDEYTRMAVEVFELDRSIYLLKKEMANKIKAN